MTTDLRLTRSFADAVSSVSRSVAALRPTDLDAESSCRGWTNLDLLRHLRANVGLWNERLDRTDRNELPTLVIDLAALDESQRRQVEELRADGLAVEDMTELNQRLIDELQEAGVTEVLGDLLGDVDRYLARVRDREVSDFRYQVLELHLHAHDLAVAVKGIHRPEDPDLLLRIWSENDATVDPSDSWQAIVAASGRVT